MKELRSALSTQGIEHLVLSTYFAVDDIADPVLSVKASAKLLERVKELSAAVSKAKAWCIKDNTFIVKATWLHREECQTWDDRPLLLVNKSSFWFESNETMGPLSCSVPISTLEQALKGKRVPLQRARQEGSTLYVAEEPWGLKQLMEYLKQ